jgi:hypothetical protein
MSVDDLIEVAAERAVMRLAAELTRPELVSQRTVLAVVGLPAIDFLEDARAGRFASRKVRRLVFARTVDVLAWIERHPVAPSTAAAKVAGDEEARVFSKYGARRVGR